MSSPILQRWSRELIVKAHVTSGAMLPKNSGLATLDASHNAIGVMPALLFAHGLRDDNRCTTL